MTWKEGRQVPDTALIRFVSRRFSYPATLLDIGSGEGANARELRERGHEVITVDKDPNVECNHPCDIMDYHPDPWEAYDLIYDINTLCHVEYPPYMRISSWLRPGGLFFSICPAIWTDGKERIGRGKEFTRFITAVDLKAVLQLSFSTVQLYERKEPDFLGNNIHSWIVVAQG